ncbi:pirin family protein [Nocardioides dongkuii]|uniref:pirin family protein n=1 Tax=Nocardioides dongkuii TaxID=2760089 RepID=UPI0018780F1A|nr:pirin family protein [Nocardioides dongkuii]
MTVEIRRASARLTERAPGRATHHSLSFGPHLDPDRLRFGPMVCHDDHLLADGQGFPEHGHSGLVIVSWVVSGALVHAGTVGGDVVVAPGQAAVLRTGDGVEHSEHAGAPRTRFVQVWLATDADDDGPSYDVVEPALVPGALTEVVAPLPGARFSVARLGIGETVALPEAARVHAYVATGALTRSSLAEPLASGDAFELTDHPSVSVTAAVPTELLVWAFDA